MYRFESATQFWTLITRAAALGETTKMPFTGKDWDDGYAQAKAELDRQVAAKQAKGFADKGIWEDADRPDYSGSDLDEPDRADDD